MGKKKEEHIQQATPAELTAHNAELTEHLQRLQAEFDNYRKRVEQEKATLRDAAADTLLSDLLPILDHLELAIEHAKEHPKQEELLTGVLMVRDQLQQLLADHGATPIETSGAFDPKRHEAIITQTTTDAPHNHITKTFQRGYARGGKILRPARVSVAKHGA